MIIDENETTAQNTDQFTFPKGTSVNKFVKCIRETSDYFLSALSGHPNKGKLNENSLTQLFVTQLNIYISNDYPFLAQTQYSDTYYGSKGVPDFFFHKRELGKDSPALFVVEAKRLPSQTFEKEYVIGKTNNGGIERFKIEKHGIGLTKCGILGFVEKDTFDDWKERINHWIEEQVNTDSNWSAKERLDPFFHFKSEGDVQLFAHLISNVIKAKPLELHHFWINCQ
ncbi:MAG: hypothetical protein KBA66_08930 [Leptospiraceae bacterium]|nr:hypothetical protein [Leptospiraceae bacterium]